MGSFITAEILEHVDPFAQSNLKKCTLKSALNYTTIIPLKCFDGPAINILKKAIIKFFQNSDFTSS